MTVPALLKSRWKTANLTGEAQHSCIARVRQGHMDHLYQRPVRLNGVPIVPPLIWKGNNHSPWQGQWVPTGPWITLPQVQSANWVRSFGKDNGSSTLTIIMDNVAFLDTEGASGLYHEIDRGHFSPMKGVKVLSRPSLWKANSWANVLNGGYQIELWEGYGTGAEVQPGGTAVKRTWVGLIETCDIESDPDQMTMTARDFGVLLTDQRLMGFNKAREIRAPVTFADRKWAQGETKQFGSPKVSSGQVHTDPKQGAVWTSARQDNPDDWQWIEIHVPKGHYEDFFLAPPIGKGHVEMYLSIQAKGVSWRHDSVPVPEGWVNWPGHGNVPGTTIPWVRHMPNVTSWARRWSLGERYDFGDGTIIRLWFRHLPKLRTGAHTASSNGKAYGMTVKALYTFRFGSNPSKPPGAKVNAHHWILVEDAADVIRMLLLWAGFKEFHVEDFGWSLALPMQFGEDKYFIDVINDILKQGNYVFYMGAPTNDDMSIGVPTFEHQKATDSPPPGMVEVRDIDLLEAVQPKWDASSLPYVIRYRGDISKYGHTLDQDRSKRFQATYYPPWSGQHYFALGNAIGGDRLNSYSPHFNRVAGIKRQFTQTLARGLSIGLQSDTECLFACLLAAVQYALLMCTGDIQIAGLPAFNLNDQVSVIDAASGVNSRLYIASIESDHTLGPNGKWTMKISGSFVDIIDMFMIGADYRYAYKQLIQVRPPSKPDTPPVLQDPGPWDTVAITRQQDD